MVALGAIVPHHLLYKSCAVEAPKCAITTLPSGVACAVYGTAVVHRVSPGCWTGSEATSVVHVTQGMAYSTWAFTALLL